MPSTQSNRRRGSPPKKNNLKKKPEKVKGAFPSIPGEITTDDLLWFWPVNRRTTGKWIERGVIHRVGYHFPAAETLRRIIAEYMDRFGRRSRKDEIQVAHLEFDLAVKKQDYLLKSDVEIAIAKVFSMFSENLNELPERLATLVAPETPELAEEQIRQVIIEILEGFCLAVETEFKVDPLEIEPPPKKPNEEDFHEE